MPTKDLGPGPNVVTAAGRLADDACGQSGRYPTDAGARKAVPLLAGCIDYFPDALAAVAALSVAGNEQHNPGQPLAWDRSKSGDELECLTRHLVDHGTFDTDGFLHDVKIAWRALANLQKALEKLRGLPISPGSVPGR